MASPLALWHLLSLDAPTVAALWTWFIARAAGIELPVTSPIAMALAVWIIYAADRLLDAHRAEANGERRELEARHHFHFAHRRMFAGGIGAACVALAAVLPTLDAAALRLYAVEGLLLTLWFAVLHATRSAHRLPKEIAVGIFFSAAVFIPTVARAPELRFRLAPAAWLLALLCALNCLFIYAWEHPQLRNPRTQRTGAAPPPHPTTRFALRRLDAFAMAAFSIGLALSIWTGGALRAICAACALSAALLLALDRSRERLSHIHLRAAADLTLLTPALLTPALLLLRGTRA